MKIKALAIAGLLIVAGALSACSTTSSYGYSDTYYDCPTGYKYDSLRDECVYRHTTTGTTIPKTVKPKVRPKTTYKAPKVNTYKAPKVNTYKAPPVRAR